MTDLETWFAAIDAANQDDPHRHGDEPLALAQGRMAEAWTTTLDPGASDALRVAARAHHLRRWVVARSTYPEGRAGYLRWRRDQKTRHASELAALLRATGAPEALVERASAIVAKTGLGSDPEVQGFEDAVCLTFIQTQFLATADKLDDDERMVEVVAKTLRKMSATGHDAAAGLAVDARTAEIIGRATTALSEG